MKLIRFGPVKNEKPGVLTPDGRRLDMSRYFSDWNSAFFAERGLSRLREILEATPAETFPEVPAIVRWGSPIARPGKVICIGLNFSDHARESGAPIPSEPVIFQKAANTVVGPYDAIKIPRGSQKTDWEIELGVVIGADARYLNSQEDAQACIAGYCISHDVSEREFQLEHGGQWTKGKSCDTFNPLGPWLVTLDEIDAAKLAMKLSVNGEVRQKGNTDTMLFNVPQIVHYLSQFMTLEAGDLINTGTPPGVGLGMKPPRYLNPGDIVELEIAGLGLQRQSCVAA